MLEFLKDNTMLLFQSMTLQDALWANRVLGWEIECDADSDCARVFDKDGHFLGTVAYC